MEWIDLKSGVALAGSLVILAGSIESRLKRGRDENPENPPDSGRSKGPEGPKIPEAPVEREDYTMATEREFEVKKPYRLKSGVRPPPPLP
jgi:hypothetical protein